MDSNGKAGYDNFDVDEEGFERVAVLEHIKMDAETKEELLVKNNSTVKRERKQAETTPNTQEIYEQLQLVLMGRDSKKIMKKLVLINKKAIIIINDYSFLCFSNKFLRSYFKITIFMYRNHYVLRELTF